MNSYNNNNNILFLLLQKFILKINIIIILVPMLQKQ